MHRFFIFKTVSTFLFPGVSEYFGSYLLIDKRLVEHLAFIGSVFILTGCFFDDLHYWSGSVLFVACFWFLYLPVSAWFPSSSGNWRKSNEE